MKRTPKIQFAYGMLLFGIFLLTGQYLKWVIKPRYLIEIDQRMMARANHIYIFFISMLNVLSSLIETEKGTRWVAACGWVSRIVLMISGCIFVLAFFQPYGIELSQRRLPLVGVVLTLVGIALSLPKTLNRRIE